MKKLKVIAPLHEVASEPADTSALEVLVVDDIPEICELFKSLQRRMRSTPTRVTVDVNSARALDMVRSQNFDLVISDFRMREVDGLEVLKAAYEQNPRGRRVLMTGYNEIPTTMGRIAAAHIDAYVQKPLKYQDTLIMVLDMLNNNPSTLAPYRAHAREVETLGSREEEIRSGRHSASCG